MKRNVSAKKLESLPRLKLTKRKRRYSLFHYQIPSITYSYSFLSPPPIHLPFFWNPAVSLDEAFYSTPLGPHVVLVFIKEGPWFYPDPPQRGFQAIRDLEIFNPRAGRHQDQSNTDGGNTASSYTPRRCCPASSFLGYQQCSFVIISPPINSYFSSMRNSMRPLTYFMSPGVWNGIKSYRRAA